MLFAFLLVVSPCIVTEVVNCMIRGFLSLSIGSLEILFCNHLLYVMFNFSILYHLLPQGLGFEPPHGHLHG